MPSILEEARRIKTEVALDALLREAVKNARDLPDHDVEDLVVWNERLELFYRACDAAGAAGLEGAEAAARDAVRVFRP